MRDQFFTVDPDLCYLIRAFKLKEYFFTLIILGQLKSFPIPIYSLVVWQGPGMAQWGHFGCMGQVDGLPARIIIVHFYDIDDIQFSTTKLPISIEI